jgi:hypothetical protein
VPIIEHAPADAELRDKWLDRLWEAVQNDDMPYLELLTDFWGELCAGPSCASKWADNLIGTVRLAWSSDPGLRGYFKGTTACLSALLRAGRNQEILELLGLAPHKFWHDRQWGMKALRWLASGYGYEITGLDVWAAYRHTMSAAERAGCNAQAFERVRRLVEGDRQADRFVTKILGAELGLNRQ